MSRITPFLFNIGGNESSNATPNATANATSNTVNTHLGVYGSDSDAKVKASITGSGAVSASVAVYGNDAQSNVGGILLYTLALSGSGFNAQGNSSAKWPYMYCTVSGLSGTNATVSVSLSE